LILLEKHMAGGHDKINWNVNRRHFIPDFNDDDQLDPSPDPPAGIQLFMVLGNSWHFSGVGKYNLLAINPANQADNI
jgi:hypothetical protein